MTNKVKLSTFLEELREAEIFRIKLEATKELLQSVEEAWDNDGDMPDEFEGSGAFRKLLYARDHMCLEYHWPE